jgi:hypothetical protein
MKGNVLGARPGGLAATKTVAPAAPHAPEGLAAGE